MSGDRAETVAVTDGLAVGFARYGDPDGLPVIWNHGGLSSRLDAAPIDVAARAAGLRVVPLDRPGIGNSDARLPVGLEAWAHTVADVADAEGMDRFGVAGWSAGRCICGRGTRTPSSPWTMPGDSPTSWPPAS